MEILKNEETTIFSSKKLFAFFRPRTVRRLEPTLVYSYSALATGTSNHAPAGGSRIGAEHIQILKFQNPLFNSHPTLYNPARAKRAQCFANF